MKQVFLFLFLSLFHHFLFAQHRDSTNQQIDSAIIKSDSLAGKRIDSFLLAQKDSARLKKEDSANLARRLTIMRKDSIEKRVAAYNASLNKILKLSPLLNTSGKPVAMVNRLKNRYSTDDYFYLLTGIAMLLACFRFLYPRYFNNLFRVFFNASLRQSQLTDQLLQAKLPSLLFNMLFVLAGGVYVYLLLGYFAGISVQQFWTVLLYSVISLTAIYLGKLVTVKFTGWLTGYKDVTDKYVFIIFLINKILGILLVPFSVVIAFAAPSLVTASVVISLLLIGLMFLLRFFRSYGLLQPKLKISRLHFFMYVLAIEIVPVLLIYKGLVLLLSKKSVTL